MSSLHRPRIYRTNPSSALVGFALMIMFGYLAWEPLVHLLSGTSMIIRDGGSPAMSTTHRSTPDQLAFQAIGFGFFSLLSLAMVLQWVNGYVVADEDGIRARNTVGLVRFQARWDEIEEVEIVTRSRCGDVYVFRTRVRKLALNNYPEAGELIALVKGRSPGVRLE